MRLKLQQGLGDTLFAIPLVRKLQLAEQTDVVTCWPQLFASEHKCYARETRLWTQLANLDRSHLDMSGHYDREICYKAPSHMSILQQYEDQLGVNYDRLYAKLPFSPLSNSCNFLLGTGQYVLDVPLVAVRSHSYRKEFPALGRNPILEDYCQAIEEYNKQGYVTAEIGWWDEEHEVAAKLPVKHRINRQPIETVLQLLMSSKLIIGPVGWICAFSMYHNVPTKIFVPEDCKWDSKEFWFDNRAPDNLQYYDKSTIS